MDELGKNLTPEQVIKLARDGARLALDPPKTYVEGGVERPSRDTERVRMMEAFLEGSVLRLSQWWRNGEEQNVATVLNALDEDTLRVVLTMAVSKLGELGYTRARFPDSPEADPRLN